MYRTNALTTGMVALAGSMALVLSGCAGATSTSSAEPLDVETTAEESAPAVTPIANDVVCADASPAALNAVNASIEAEPGGAGVQTLPWATVVHDDELGKWLLTGSFDATDGVSDGFFAVWASTEDPTADTFDAPLEALEGSAEGNSDAPPMIPPYVGPTDMDAAPPAALFCAQERLAGR